ncbi:MAG: CHAT domain-containing protein, partial [Planctomycetota bacterium]
KTYHLPSLPGETEREERVSQRETLSTDRAYLLAISPAGIRAVRVGTTRDLAERVELFRMTLEAQRWCQAVEDYARLARALYEDLLQPVLEGEEGGAIRHLIISPDGPLTRLAFDALLVEPAEKDSTFARLRYVASKYSTEYTPSASIWLHQRRGRFRRGEPGKGFVGLADPDYGEGVSSEAVRSSGALGAFLPEGSEEAKKRTERREELLSKLSPEVARALREAEGTRGGLLLGRLPGTRQEVTSIAKLFQAGWTEEHAVVSLDKEERKERASPVKVFFGGGAREVVAKRRELLGGAGIVHFACHGVADDLSPAEASVILATRGLSEEEDGFLTAREVMRLRTNARLVVLSACETGLGTVLRGEGVQGLTRAFQYAGARSVIVSLWKVDDRATTEFMKAFYGALKAKEGMSVTAALARARGEMFSRVKVAAPLYWAAFTCHGER